MLGYAPRGLPALACVQLAVSRWGCFTRWDTPLGGLPHPPHTHPPLDLLGCIFCNSVTLLYKAHALPYSAGLTHAPENAHLGAPAGIRPSKASRPYLRPDSSTRSGCCARWDTPLGGFLSLLASSSQYPAGGAGGSGYAPRELPALACVQLAVLPSGWLLPLPPHAPTLSLLGCIFYNSVTPHETLRPRA